MPIEDTFAPGRMPSARMRDRTIDVDSVELEVIDGGAQATRSWLGGGALLAASVSLVVGTAAFFVLDEARFRPSSDSPVAPSPRTSSAPPLPSSRAPEVQSPALAAPAAMGQATAETVSSPAHEAKPATVGDVAREPDKPLRKRAHTKRMRTVSSTSTRTVTKRIQRP